MDRYTKQEVRLSQPTVLPHSRLSSMQIAEPDSQIATGKTQRVAVI